MRDWLLVAGTVLLVLGIELLEGTVQLGDTVSRSGIRLELDIQH